jgi:hypothetical protein
MRLFENRMLRRIFGPKRDKETREWRKIHNEELNYLYSSPNIVRVIQIEKNEMGEACSTYGERRGLYRVLVGNPEGKISLGRPRRRWEDTIKMDPQGVGFGGMDWIRLSQDRDRWRALVGEGLCSVE